MSDQQSNAELLKKMRTAAALLPFSSIPAPIKEALAAAVELMERLEKKVNG